MRILYYFWGENSAPSMLSALTELGHEVTQFQHPLKDYHNDSAFEVAFKKALLTKSFDFIFSFDFFPLVAKTAKAFSVPYLSWIYDMPHTTLFSPEALSSYNHIFLFDKTLMNQLAGKNREAHLYYLPLATSPDQFDALPKTDAFSHDVAFLGSLYENCLYNQINYLPDYLTGYLNGFFSAQVGNYLFHTTEDILTGQIYDELQKWVALELRDTYTLDKRSLYVELIDKKLSSLDRIYLLQKCSEFFPVSLYTGSQTDMLPKVKMLGYANNQTEMPLIFHNSKINLNISLRTITTGIPLRCMDIMGAGGLLVSNYQEELAELFEDGQDMILFYNGEDLQNKIDYLLSHESERAEIAYQGNQKIRNCYTYNHQVTRMLSLFLNQI